MKNLHAAAAGLILFTGGLFLGREFFPANPGTPETPPQKDLSTRTAPSPRSITTTTPAAKGTSELLELVDLNDPFSTNRALGKNLEKLDSLELVSLLTDLENSSKEDPKFQTTRTQIFNHLALADPALALETLLASPDDYFKQSHLSIVILQLARSDFSSARSAVENLPDNNLKNVGLNHLIDAAMELDPQSLPELLAQAESSSPLVLQFQHYDSWSDFSWGHQSYQIPFNAHSYLSKWAAKDPEAAEAYALGLQDPGQRSRAYAGIAAARARTDPEGALAWAQSLTGTDERNASTSSALLAISAKNPRKVAEMLGEISDPNTRQSLIHSVTQSWIKTDQASALAWLQSLPSSAAKTQALNSALQSISQENPQAGVALLDQLPPNHRSNNLGQLAAAWAQKDLNAAKSWVTSLENPFDLRTGLEGILGIWAQEDPRGAADFVQNSPTLQGRNQSRQLDNIARQWATKDPSSALQWAQSLEDPKSQSSALANIYAQWSATNPEEAKRHLPDLNEPEQRQSVISTLLSNWTHRDPEAALQWFDQLPREDRFRNATQLISSLSSHDPENAAAQLARLTAEAGGDENTDRQLASSASSLASQWINHDVQAAATWAANLTHESARESALTQIASNWARTDPVGASEWIDNLTDPKARDAGVRNLVDQFTQVDPASAFDWAQTMSSDSSRTSTIRGVLRDWVQSDKEAALQAYSNADLTKEQRDQIDYVFKQ